MLRDIITDKRALFPAGCHTELRAQINRSRSVTILSGNLTGNSRVEVSGVGARVYKNGVWGFSSAAALNDEAARDVLAAAADNASFMDSHIKAGKGPLPFPSEGNLPLNRIIEEIPQEVYIEYLRRLDEYAEKNCKSLVSRSVSVREDSMEKMLLVSDGMSAHTAAPRSYVYIFMTAETPDGTPVDLFAPIGGSGIFTENFKFPEELFGEVDNLYKKLLEKRCGVWAEAGEKTVILGAELAGMLAHEAVGHTVEADLVAGGSVASHMLGKRVGSELVNLTDFAFEALGAPAPLPVCVDDEGTKAVDDVIIKDGILVGYINDRESAEKYGMEPTGNARAYSFSDEPLIRMRNTAILPGESSLEEMISTVKDGYYLIDTNNGQADTTGEFMFGISMGYEIKDGKLGRAILDTTLSGVAFEMLKTVDMVSRNMHWASSGFCGKKQPMPVGMGGPEIRCRAMIGGR
ncbi:MAG: TldD/PmbA family protein [Ruminococcaceae bacterium]|nr:TldD/PmbA family protein [Oscillospiraceae bacterium]